MVASTLLDAAVDQFGRLGFEGASTREIARASNTAMSSITYHFGGKEGLYLAAADHIAACVAGLQRPRLDAAREAGRASPEAATEGMLAILDGFAQMMLQPKSEAWSRFILREQQHPTEAFERLYQGMMRHVLEAGLELLGIVRPDLDERSRRALGVLLFGEVIMLRACRASVCKVMQVDRIDEATAALLRARVRANALSILSEKL